MTVPPQIPQLPPASRVEVGKLEALFRSKINSYKFLLFRAILQLLKEEQESHSCVMRFADLRLEMLINAWFSSRFFLLNLGNRDQVSKSLDEIYAGGLFANETMHSAEIVRKEFTVHADDVNDILDRKNIDITHYVIYRLLTPWFAELLRGKSDAIKNDRLHEFSNQMFYQRKPLYKIDRQAKTITLHGDWVDYLNENYGIVEGWLDMQWLKYLQRNNPNVPALSSKLWAVPMRESMQQQRSFWLPLVEQGFDCIYTGSPVPADDFALDHFLPWSWIGHNQLWNLVPVSRTVNSKKGLNLPPAGDIEKLADAHVRMVKFHLERSGRNVPRKFEDYLSGLNIVIDERFDEERMMTAYEHTVRPQMQLALDRGFERCGQLAGP